MRPSPERSPRPRCLHEAEALEVRFALLMRRLLPSLVDCTPRFSLQRAPTLLERVAVLAVCDLGETCDAKRGCSDASVNPAVQEPCPDRSRGTVLCESFAAPGGATTFTDACFVPLRLMSSSSCSGECKDTGENSCVSCGARIGVMCFSPTASCDARYRATLAASTGTVGSDFPIADRDAPPTGIGFDGVSNWSTCLQPGWATFVHDERGVAVVVDTVPEREFISSCLRPTWVPASGPQAAILCGLPPAHTS